MGISQSDLPRQQKSGFSEALNVLKNVDGIEQVFLTPDDVVRHSLVQKIIVAYENAYGGLKCFTLPVVMASNISFLRVASAPECREFCASSI